MDFKEFLNEKNFQVVTSYDNPQTDVKEYYQNRKLKFCRC